MSEVYDKLQRCYESVRAQTDFVPEVALVLGSGLGDYAENIRVEKTIDYHDIEGFPVSTVVGHAGRFILVMWMICRLSACRDVCIIMKDIP